VGRMAIVVSRIRQDSTAQRKLYCTARYVTGQGRTGRIGAEGDPQTNGQVRERGQEEGTAR
jgi:hypothetical protein